jgi:hypothetical protein
VIMDCVLVADAVQIDEGHSQTGNRSTRDGTEVLCRSLKLLYPQRLDSAAWRRFKTLTRPFVASVRSI